jgi:hypothetical protein
MFISGTTHKSKRRAKKSAGKFLFMQPRKTTKQLFAQMWWGSGESTKVTDDSGSQK